MKNTQYITPTAKIISLTIERGFEASLENPITDPEIDW